MSLSTPSRSLNLRLLASLLRPSAAYNSRPHSTPCHTLHRPFSTSPPRPQHAPSSPTSSVSQTEVSHFSRLASSWWDPHGPSRLLHLMNPLRHDFINSCLQHPEPTEPGGDPATAKKHTYLDIGCGGGIFSSSAARLPSTASVTAIDPAPSVIAVAKAHQRSDPALSEPKLRYLNCAVEDLPLHHQPTAENNPTSTTTTTTPAAPPFDIITLFEVLEHIDSPSAFLQTVIPHLTPGGWLIGSTIARSPLSFLTTKLIAEAPLIGVVPRGTHDWNKYINPDELADWFADRDGDGGSSGSGGWGTMRTQGVIYLPGLGWKMVDGSEGYGNYFFGVQRLKLNHK